MPPGVPQRPFDVPYPSRKTPQDIFIGVRGGYVVRLKRGEGVPWPSGTPMASTPPCVHRLEAIPRWPALHAQVPHAFFFPSICPASSPRA